MFNTNTLFASLIWGSVGVAYFIYGKKQSALVPMVGGVVIVGVSYLASPLAMSLICALIIAAIYLLLKLGY
jgi:hypothetical protein